MKRGIGHIARDKINKSVGLIDKWKVLVPEAYNGGDGLPHQILGKPEIAPPPSVCTQSYLVFYVESKAAAASVRSYYSTRFFRFLVSQRKITQHALNSTYKWVPAQSWDQNWTDSALYEKYGITEGEQAYIESQVKPMNIADGDDA
jgi:site-specific DNA-methyltransferase (adenine-specific)